MSVPYEKGIKVSEGAEMYALDITGDAFQS
jgi:hypothetical protein